MKKLFPLLTFIALLTFSACPSAGDHADDADTTLVGKWALTESLIDIGNGQGTFQSIESEKIIEFLDNGKVISNGPLCQMSSETTTAGEGDYDRNEKTISATDCNFELPPIRYEHNGGELILWYPCMEPCGHKFVKVRE